MHSLLDEGTRYTCAVAGRDDGFLRMGDGGVLDGVREGVRGSSEQAQVMMRVCISRISNSRPSIVAAYLDHVNEAGMGGCLWSSSALCSRLLGSGGL